MPGLQYVRRQQLPKALESLAKAARLRPDNARYAYVYAVALNGNGESERSVRILETCMPNIPMTGCSVCPCQLQQAMGNMPAATAYANKLVEMDPRYGSVEQIMQQLSSP